MATDYAFLRDDGTMARKSGRPSQGAKLINEEGARSSGWLCEIERLPDLHGHARFNLGLIATAGAPVCRLHEATTLATARATDGELYVTTSRT